MAKKRKAPEFSDSNMELNMTPMIDVVFQLLIFFLLSPMHTSMEGKLQSTLPKDKGLFSSPVPTPEINEVRIKLKYDKNKKSTAVSTGFQGKEPVGEVYPSRDNPDAAKRNPPVYAALRDRVQVLYKQVAPSRAPSKPAPVIIEANGDTPYEHVIGVMNACKEDGVLNIEFAANPEHQEEKWFKNLMQLNK